jgi:hypothetical protein
MLMNQLHGMDIEGHDFETAVEFFLARTVALPSGDGLRPLVERARKLLVDSEQVRDSELDERARNALQENTEVFRRLDVILGEVMHRHPNQTLVASLQRTLTVSCWKLGNSAKRFIEVNKSGEPNV